MIFSISQVRTNFDMVWIADCKGKCVCVAKAPFEKGAFNIYLEYPDQEDQHLYYNPDDLRFGDSLLEKHSFKLFMNRLFVVNKVKENLASHCTHL